MQTSQILYSLNYRDQKQKYEGYVAKISCHMCGKEIELKLGKTWNEKYNFIQNITCVCVVHKETDREK